MAGELINPVVAVFAMLWSRQKWSHWMRIFGLPRSVKRFIFLLAVIFPKIGSTRPVRFE